MSGWGVAWQWLAPGCPDAMPACGEQLDQCRAYETRYTGDANVHRCSGRRHQPTIGIVT